MNTIHRNPNERGSAILLVLGFLSLLLMMAMIFAVTSRNAQIAADAKADETNAQLQARSAATQAQETIFFLQNKGNIIGSVNTDLGNCLPGNDDNLEQSPTTLTNVTKPTKDNPGKQFFYGKDNDVNSDHLGLQPYVGYTTNELPNSWRFLAFYGELAMDAYATTPFGITFPDATKVNPYQSIYYSHATEDAAVDFDEVDYQGDNSLYEIVKDTKLGNLYYEATGGAGGQFEQLLKNDKSTQLQFRNFFEADEEDSTKKHVFSRQGFIMFNEGSKFDVNRLVSPGMASDTDEPYVPFVGGDGTVADDIGALTLGEPGTGLNIDVTPGCSTYAIMGREYAADEYTSDQVYTSIDEDLTVQYGLHPAELQTRIMENKAGEKVPVYGKGLGRMYSVYSPRWFSYEHLLDYTENIKAYPSLLRSDDTLNKHLNSTGDPLVTEALKTSGDIFTLCVEGGADDRELRFNGQYASMTDLLKSIGTLRDSDGDGVGDELAITNAKIDSLNKIDLTSKDCSYLAKTNIAFPWGVYCSGRNTSCSTFGCANPTWDDIGEKLSSVTAKGKLQDYAKHFFVNHLGLNYEPGTEAMLLDNDFVFSKIKEGDEAKSKEEQKVVDLTPEVFANLTDFCDSDYAVTYLATQDGSTRLTMSSDNLAIAPRKSTIAANHMVEPTFCSNERVPVVVGVSVSMEGDADTLSVIKNERKSFSVNGGGGHGGGDTVYVYRTSLTGDMKFTPRVTLSLQNFLNEKLGDADQTYRVIIQGKIVPFLLEKKVTLKHENRKGSHTVETKYGNTVLFPKYNLIGALELTDYDINSNLPNANSAEYGLAGTNTSGTYLVKNGDVRNHLDDDTKYWSFCIDKKSAVISRDFKPLENQSIEIECDELAISLNGLYSNNQSTTGPFGHEWGGLPESIGDLSTGTTNYYYCTGMGYAVKIEKIEVLVRNSKNLDTELCELAYAETSDSATSIVCASKGGEGYSDGTMNSVTTFKTNLGELATIDGVTCCEPRMNHLSDSWTWFANHPQKSDSAYFGSGYCTYSNKGTTKGVLYNGLEDREGTGAIWRQGTFAKVSLETVRAALQNDSDDDMDWEPDFVPGVMSPTPKGTYYSSTMDTTISTYFIPNSPISSLWQLGAVHRGAEGQTINLKKFGTDGGTITHEYGDGDAWILDYLKLNELDANHGIRGKFNPNSFNAGAYRFLFANIPSNEDAKETMIYANRFYDPETEVQRNTYFRDFIGGTAPATYVDLEDKVFRFKEVGSGKDYPQVSGTDGILAAQSWSPVQAFFNFVDVDGGGSGTYACNDRQAESLIGCTAGLLSTRYEVFTAIAVGQSVKFLMSAADMNALMTANDIKISPSTEDEKKEQTDFLNRHFTNPIKITFYQGGNTCEWYSILSTQVREITFVRDCWFGKITVLKSRLL